MNQSCYFLAEVLIGIATLAAIVWYAFLTRGLQKETLRIANETANLAREAQWQRAASVRPAFLFKLDHRPLDEALITARLRMDEPGPTPTGYLPSGKVLLQNVGNGPALNVVYDFDGEEKYRVPDVPVGGPLTPGNGPRLPETFTLCFESILGFRYRLAARFEHDEISGVNEAFLVRAPTTELPPLAHANGDKTGTI
jgi:hypothetical protein